ncbi:Aliphatic amidase expression-regulating protein [Legionella waltersii]|uniref:Aliphatic amidase expression-regulating protein n=2 Tax=Legionella waltersii TaxID=66969 RepID=A0A0W1AAH4_9GAMM|nr:ABC transporter substrate-binding protein [Legionella waltersii]KTD78329.1 Aliphatic amidase expression-regulating protein [Legionella waltersii]SNV08673.1 Aliphatic amidase expression-regulating protein [Legionella waltersii]
MKLFLSNHYIKLAAISIIGMLFLSCSSNDSVREPIKIGILQSLSGVMGNSETSLKDTLLMEIDLINQEGGVLGHPVEPVIENPESNWSLYPKKAKKLLLLDKVAVIFGCWTSVSRKAVLPVLEKYNGLLFYPVQYEGGEQSNNIFYTGLTPNQQVIPAIQYLMGNKSNPQKQWILVGTDYIYPHVTNMIVRQYLNSKGVASDSIKEYYFPFEYSDFGSLINEVYSSLSKGPTAVISTINGESNFYFYRALNNEGFEAEDLEVMAFSVSEEEFRGYHINALGKVYTSWSYFMSLDNPINNKWIEDWIAYSETNHLRGEDHPLTTDPMEATRTGIRMWKAAVEQAGTFDVDAVRKAMIGQKLETPSGYIESMEPNHHLAKPAMIGQLQKNGQFKVIWKSKKVIPPQPFYFKEFEDNT